MTVELIVFLLAAAGILAGAIGVVASSNPVHAALSLVGTLFGVAVLFVAQDADFLAAVQVIVYAGAIVVLFLFVIMLLGVDRTEDLTTDPLVGQRPAAVAAGLGLLGVLLTSFFMTERDFDTVVTGVPGDSPLGQLDADNVRLLGETLFREHLYAFEITSVLLIIAVVAAVVLARRMPRGDIFDEDEAANRAGAPD